MVDFYNKFKDFKSFEVVLNNDEKQPQKIFCTVNNIENNRIILTADNSSNKNINADIGDSIILYIYTENGIYSSNSKILSLTKNDDFSEYVISYPEDIKHSQRREYFRADMNINFKLEVETDDNNEKLLVINSKTQNICGKGMSYISDKPFPAYNLIKAELYFNDRTIETSANLVYSKQLLVNNCPKFIHAFTFSSISQKKIDFIVKKCFLHQLNLKKKLKI